MSIKEIKERLVADAAGKPVKNAPASGKGVVISQPGTERVLLELKHYQLMECEGNIPGKNKKRYTIVEKGVSGLTERSFVNARGETVHVVTKRVFDIMLNLLSTADRAIKDLTADMKVAQTERDGYKTIIDALRRNGIID